MRIVDDRREVGGRDEHHASGEPHDRRIIAAVQLDQHLRCRITGDIGSDPADHCSPGGILHAQPPPCTYWVSRIGRGTDPGR